MDQTLPNDDLRIVGDSSHERQALTEELLEIGRHLADLPEDGAFGERIDLRERQKELRLRLAELEEAGADDEVIDLEYDDLVAHDRLPPERHRY